MRNKSLSCFIIVILTVAFLTISVGRVTRVSAMADPVIQDVAPVYDTVIYQFKDYVENDLTEPQYEIFALLWGLYTSAMAGAEDYKLANPYESQDGVLNWLKGLGVDAYNTLISLAPDTITMPDGSFLNTVPIKEKLSDTIAVAMGMAVTASQYDDLDDFMDDVDDENRSHYWIPFSDVTMYGMNSIFETYGGIYAWQFDTVPWTTDFVWKTQILSPVFQAQYDSVLSNLSGIHIKGNSSDSDYYNLYVGFDSYLNLFLDTSDSTVYIVNDQGQRVSTIWGSHFVYSNSNNYNSNTRVVDQINFISRSFNLYDTTNYASIASDVFNSFTSNDRFLMQGSYSSSYRIQFDPLVLIPHVYVGDSWPSRHEIYNIQGHNLVESDQPYYLSPDSQSQFYMDIKGMIQDLINNTNLMNVFLQNIYTPDGVLVHDTDLIRVSLRLLQDYEQQNPPIPVNLNDIAEITDVSYLQKLKEEATRGGNALAELVAFWHNCDAEIIYLLFGAGITVLIGAFIGKWGHS